MTAKKILDYINWVGKKYNIKVWTEENLRLFQNTDSDYSEIEFDSAFDNWYKNTLKPFYTVGVIGVRWTTAKKIFNNAYLWAREKEKKARDIVADD
jgi:hypothetical protein